jgi:hypothetical protein
MSMTQVQVLLLFFFFLHSESPPERADVKLGDAGVASTGVVDSSCCSRSRSRNIATAANTNTKHSTPPATPTISATGVSVVDVSPTTFSVAEPIIVVDAVVFAIDCDSTDDDDDDDDDDVTCDSRFSPLVMLDKLEKVDLLIIEIAFVDVSSLMVVVVEVGEVLDVVVVVVDDVGEVLDVVVTSVVSISVLVDGS